MESLWNSNSCLSLGHRVPPWMSKDLGQSQQQPSETAIPSLDPALFWNEESWSILIVGPPSAGKSTLIKGLLNDGPLSKQFHWIFFFSRTPIEGLSFQEGENWIKSADTDTMELILEWVNSNKPDHFQKNNRKVKILFVLDD